MKKIITLMMLVCMLLAAAPAAVAEGGDLPFTDVKAGKWYYAAVKTVYDEGIMNGKTKTTFDPTAPMTRAELVTTLARVACVNVDGAADNLAFKDTKKSAWYAPYVGWGVSAGLVKGYEDNTFRPNAPINRQELATLIVRFIDYMEARVEADSPVKSFADEEKIPKWAKQYVEELRKTGLMKGDTAGRFNPASSATRAEVAQIVTRLLPFTSRMNVAVNGESAFVIVADTAIPGVADAAERLAWQLEHVCGVTVETKLPGEAPDGGIIRLLPGGESLGEDGFEITVSDGSVTVRGETDRGLYRGAVRLVNDFQSGGNLRLSGKSAERVEFAYPVGSITLLGRDISEYTIYYPEGMTAKAMESVLDLGRYIKMACGADVPVKEGEPVSPAIIIDTSDPTDPHSYSIRTEGDDLIISGCDHADTDLGLAAGNSMGISFGIYAFLDRFVGVRFLTKDMDYVIPAEAIEIGETDMTSSPVIRDRIIYWTDYLESARLKLKNGVGDTVVWVKGSACHTFDALDGDFSEQYTNQPCLTDEAVYERMLANVMAWIRENPNCTYVSISQNDNVNYCQCDRCKAVTDEYGQSGLMIMFVNRLAREIAKEYPNLRIHTFAYSYTEDPPLKEVHPEPNVSVQLCTINQCFVHPLSGENACDQHNRDFIDRIGTWSDLSSELMIWDYTNNFAYRACPFPNLSYEILAGNMQLFADCNATYLFAQGNGTNGNNGEYDHLRAYLLAKLAWDPYMSEDEYYGYMREYMQGFYGGGWEEMYDTLILMHSVRLPCLEVFDNVGVLSMFMRKIIPDLLANYEDALIRTESKTTFENVDCSGIQFIYAYLEAFYSADYNGGDPEARQAWVDAAFLMQSKMQKYKVKFSDAYPPPELYEITAPPNQWKEMMDEQMGLD